MFSYSKYNCCSVNCSLTLIYYLTLMYYLTLIYYLTFPSRSVYLVIKDPN